MFNRRKNIKRVILMVTCKDVIKAVPPNISHFICEILNFFFDSSFFLDSFRLVLRISK